MPSVALTLSDAPQAISTPEDADRALLTIAMAEVAEKHWARAKDAKQLYKAVRAKLHNQAAYAVYRQNVVKPAQGIDHRNPSGTIATQISDQKLGLPALDPGAVVIHRWRERLCKKIKATQWEIDEEKMRGALEDAQERCRRICEQENLGTIRGTEGTGEFERYTPSYYIEKARDVLGTIDLDPATSDLAQQTVQAEQYFTAEDDGLGRDWHGRVWLNPPYHRELAPLFIKKLLDELEAGRVTEAIVLTNNSTDTEWFRSAALVCDAICFTAGRIHFEVPNAQPVLPTQGQAFFYFGPNLMRFIGVFEPVGICMSPVFSDERRP